MDPSSNHELNLNQNLNQNQNTTSKHLFPWDDASVRALGLFPIPNPRQAQRVTHCFVRVPVEPIAKPVLIGRSADCISLITDRAISDNELRDVTAGVLVDNPNSYAHCYCGFQFGYFAGQLGDGRAIVLGEVSREIPTEDKQRQQLLQHYAQSFGLPRNMDPPGHWKPRMELQLKGAGKTPFSRQADGRAVLRSSIREYIASEAMFGLGIPTTRAAALVVSDLEGGTTVLRDVYYNGDAKFERCAIVMRVSPTFIRFGSFEIFRDKDPQTGQSGPAANFDDAVKRKRIRDMSDFLIENHFVHIPRDSPDAITSMLRDVCRSTARLIAQWQSVGFVHGVLNTDNLSILGVTIDYGPYGFLESFKPFWKCNYSDKNGRYVIEEQPQIGVFNLEYLFDNFRILFRDNVSAENASRDEQDLTIALFPELSRAECDLAHQRYTVGGEATTGGDAESSSSSSIAHPSRLEWTYAMRNLVTVEYKATYVREFMHRFAGKLGFWEIDRDAFTHVLPGHAYPSSSPDVIDREFDAVCECMASLQPPSIDFYFPSRAPGDLPLLAFFHLLFHVMKVLEMDFTLTFHLLETAPQLTERTASPNAEDSAATPSSLLSLMRRFLAACGPNTTQRGVAISNKSDVAQQLLKCSARHTRRTREAAGSCGAASTDPKRSAGLDEIRERIKQVPTYLLQLRMRYSDEAVDNLEREVRIADFSDHVDAESRQIESFEHHVIVALLDIYERLIDLHLSRFDPSASFASYLSARTAAFSHRNPCVVPRNWQLQETIDSAERGDYSPIETLKKRLETPFQKGERDLEWEPPSELKISCVSCSS